MSQKCKILWKNFSVRSSLRSLINSTVNTGSGEKINIKRKPLNFSDFKYLCLVFHLNLFILCKFDISGRSGWLGPCWLMIWVLWSKWDKWEVWRRSPVILRVLTDSRGNLTGFWESIFLCRSYQLNQLILTNSYCNRTRNIQFLASFKTLKLPQKTKF